VGAATGFRAAGERVEVRMTDASDTLSATCHCGNVKVTVARKPDTLTSCNCSICRRYGALWAYYREADVKLVAAPGTTDDYSWGERSQRFVRCSTCGCVMQWRKLSVDADGRTGVNARNFDPSVIAGVTVRLLDGADTWRYIE
jgi:hypothetical protein